MDKDKLYAEHLDEMFGTALLDNLTEEDVDNAEPKNQTSKIQKQEIQKWAV